ncbi:TPA: hypothetical protein NY502_003672 [Escherichia coli]|uniref:hypothetical protein n=1 Tax=Escherichia coli TaxID=562 RepID=UPI0005A73EAD|nr:hypothetical protein [Escherichia coli]AXO85287.1 hypothetical protein AXA56_19360 [Escherichia coli]EMB3655509.1 hypothetical protein [Escherichia coli]HBB8832741.1 hypothetical protein [Escherichia coli]HCK2553495.1 hypothetical protein [Escherichia coli]HCQ8771779.1 hypothetical protein [Escherichia coli]
MKYTWKGENERTHWQRCEKSNAPFICLSIINKNYANLFYDVTSYCVDLENISNEILEIYSAYVRVFILPEHFINEIAAQYYVMNVIVRREHAEFIAEILYDYLLKKLQ